MDVILGLNGFVWVSSGTTAERREGGEGFDAEGVYSDKNDVRTDSRKPSGITFLAEVVRPDNLGRISR